MTAIRYRLSSHLLFAGAVALVLLALASACRLALLAYNANLAAAIPAVDLARALLIGVRFDLTIVAWILIPFALALLFPLTRLSRRLLLAWAIVAASIMLFAGVAEPGFYREFHQRLNDLVLDYMAQDPATVVRMLWYGFPLARYLLVWAGGSVAIGLLLWWLARRTALTVTRPARGRTRLIVARALTVAVCTVAIVVAARGTLRQGRPLSWGDAFHSRYLFANQLGLNGLFSFSRALMAHYDRTGTHHWWNRMPAAKARAITRSMVLGDHDTLVDGSSRALERRYTPTDGSGAIRNIVIILMESFGGQYVGALGNHWGITPNFDRLAGQGLLFTRFFSNGTHTHQGMFATLACFPNLPGHEYLMQQPAGNQAFSGVISLLSQRRYQSLYVYNGDFNWDNQRGFFTNQGMQRFIGRFDYHHPHFFDPTWGVSDQDMFERAARELAAMPADRPFLAVLQSLSNHTPFALPKKLPVQPVTSRGALLNRHLTAMRYSDWALGQFFRRVQQLPLYHHTLFVILGDHSFSRTEPVTDIDLMRFHIPLLLIGPGVKPGSRSSVVGSQVDVVPTIMGLLGKPVLHQCWGRDLRALAPDDRGFAVIKPSGSDPRVALVRGDDVLVYQPAVGPKLYRYRFGSDNSASRLDDPAQVQTMMQQLTGYIRTGIDTLRQRRAGVVR